MGVNLRDVQGNVLRGYRHMHFATYLFCEFAHEKKPPRELLRHLAAPAPADGDAWPHVMSAEPWREKSAVHEALNVALTFRGVTRLGWGEWFDESRFEAFRQGMLERSTRLGDDRETWQPQLTREVDLLFVVYAESESRRTEKVDYLRSQLGRWGLTEALLQDAAATPSAEGSVERDRFGFSDGFSQPVVDLEVEDHYTSQREAIGEGVLRRPWSMGRWRSLRPGEFLLGHRDEDGVTAGDFDAASPHHNGTFMVWRKLEQHVDAFEQFFRDAGDCTDAKMLKAKVVGRWQDGTSLVDARWTEPAARSGKPGNGFSYFEDGDGARCPVGAHVRRANPRESLGYGTERTKRHRIIRRGLPYKDAHGEGLVFVCFNASISRQFELVQGSWLMDGDAFGLGTEQDFLLGQGGPEAMMTIPGDRQTPAKFLSGRKQVFVTPRGGHYLFLPGLRALRAMADGPSAGPPERTRSRKRALFGITIGITVRRCLKERGAVDHEAHV
jgi:Dyp-type peroxidase family